MLHGDIFIVYDVNDSNFPFHRVTCENQYLNENQKESESYLMGSSFEPLIFETQIIKKIKKSLNTEVISIYEGINAKKGQNCLIVLVLITLRIL